MNLRVHLSSRLVLTFEYTGGDIDALVRQMKPKELFNRPAHQFLGSLKMVTVNPEEVEWIEVDTDQVPKNTNLRGTPVMKQLSTETFNKRVAQEKANFASAMDDIRQQHALTAFGMATFRSGESFCVEIQAGASPGDDRGTASVRIFQLPAVIVQREQGGIVIVNPKNIVVWQIVPGLKKSAFFSIPAEFKAIVRT